MPESRDRLAEQVAVPAAFEAVRELFPHLPPAEAAALLGRLVGVIADAIELYRRARAAGGTPSTHTTAGGLRRRGKDRPC